LQNPVAVKKDFDPDAPFNTHIATIKKIKNEPQYYSEFSKTIKQIGKI